MSDMFHKDVPVDFVADVFRVMNECPQHQFQVLTKRPERRSTHATLTWSANIWMGTSVESAIYTHRIETLRQVPAAIRFLSCEPLLGAIPAHSKGFTG